MQEEFGLMLVFIVIFGIGTICSVRQYKRINEKVDGVERIDGITYLIKDADISYVMYKLNSTCISKNIKEKEFQVINEREGILTFGGINYTLSPSDIGNRWNIGAGASYRVKCEQCGNDVIMKVSFEKKSTDWFLSDKRYSELVLNQAYHRFFKEALNVQVISQDKK